MQISLRLYYPTDVDLIAIRLLYGKNFQTIIRDCLSSFIKEEEYILPLPDNMKKYVRQIKKPIIVNFTVNDTEDIAEYLSKIRPYAKSDIVKTIVRSCYEYFPAGLFLFDSESHFRKSKSYDIETVEKRKVVINKKDSEIIEIPEKQPEKNLDNQKPEVKETERKNIDDNNASKPIPEEVPNNKDVKQNDNDYYFDEEEPETKKEKPEEPAEPGGMDAFDILQGMMG